jgi:hypothetical protein
MDNLIRHSAPDCWIEQVFAAKAVGKGGVIRRNRYWVDAEIGRERFIAEVRKRGFHLLETSDQLIVVCHNGAVRMHF